MTTPSAIRQSPGISSSRKKWRGGGGSETDPTLTGPWSAQRDLDPEFRSSALQGRIALTCARKSSDVYSIVRDLSLYFLRFARLDVAAATASPQAAARRYARRPWAARPQVLTRRRASGR